MTTNEIPRIEGVGSPASRNRLEAVAGWGSSHPKTEAGPQAAKTEARDQTAKTETFLPGNPRTREADEELPAARTAQEPPALFDTYVRIRYDEADNKYLIQVLDSTNDAVIREIPPESWAKINTSVPLPKGMIVEKKQ